jgi:hypothetical protein
LERKNNPSRFSKDKMRGTGLGYALYSEIIKQGKRPRRVEWNVLDWNTPAIEFYEKSGAKVLRDWYVVQMDEVGINNFIENKLKNKITVAFKS